MNLHNIVIAAAGNPIPDGTGTWAVTNPVTSTAYPTEICWSGNKFFASAFLSTSYNTSSSAYMSSNGTTWSSITSTVGTSVATSIFAKNNIVIIYGVNPTSNKIKVSTDSGNTFSTVTLPFTPYVYYNSHIGYINGAFVMLNGDSISYSADALIWSANSPLGVGSNTTVWSNIVNTATTAFAVGTGGACISSSDGVTWNVLGNSGVSITLPNRNLLAWNGSVLCVVSRGARTISTSPDGVTWTTNTNLSTAMGGTGSVNALIHNNKLFFAFTTGGGVYTSLDGVTWTARTALSASSWGTTDCGAAGWNGEQLLVISAGGATGFLNGVTS